MQSESFAATVKYLPTVCIAADAHDDLHGADHLLSDGSRHARGVAGAVRVNPDVVYQFLHGTTYAVSQQECANFGKL